MNASWSVRHAAARAGFVLGATVVALLSFFGTASADTVYFFLDMGKTYQNHLTSQCVWYDERIGTGAPCYKGVWSDTQLYYGGNTARVWERASHHDFACTQLTCIDFYSIMVPDPIDLSLQWYVSTGGAHYYAGNFGGQPVNVVGYAWHANETIAPGSWFYTQSYTYY